jgi:hypothetical protein
VEPNLKVSLSSITTALNNYSKRLGTRTEKHQFYELVEGLGTTIAKQNTPIQGGAGNANPGGFNTNEWMTECGVHADWATLAA